MDVDILGPADAAISDAIWPLFRDYPILLDGRRDCTDAGLTAYNHNVDTSREFYPSVISTRTYDERLQTIANANEAGLSVCTGGILGLGEEAKDHVGLLFTVHLEPEQKGIVKKELDEYLDKLRSLRSKMPGIPGTTFICPHYRVFRGWKKLGLEG
jgi:hypothetical protein